ncbi:MAG: hypothetical protein XE04_0290, partial [Marinimicrobia bacterium 46_43]
GGRHLSEIIYPSSLISQFILKKDPNQTNLINHYKKLEASVASRQGTWRLEEKVKVKV